METHNTQAGFGLVVIISFVALTLLGGGIYLASNSQSETSVENQEAIVEVPRETAGETGDEMENDEDVMMDDEMDKDSDMDEDHSGVMEDVMKKEPITIVPVDAADLMTEVTAGSFEDYDASKLSMAEEGSVVLFFHAPWCPSCRGLESDVNKNISTIPDGVHLLKVDYDSETDLKKKYGVVRQHTLVEVDSGGNAIKTLTGLTNTLDQVVSQL